MRPIMARTFFVPLEVKIDNFGPCKLLNGSLELKGIKVMKISHT